MNRKNLALTLAACLSLFASSGCTEVKHMTGTDTAPAITIDADPGKVYVKGTAKVQARTRNTLGHNAAIVWQTTMGTIKPQEGGASALFTAGDIPGVAIITASLQLDGVTVAQDDDKIKIVPFAP